MCVYGVCVVGSHSGRARSSAAGLWRVAVLAGDLLLHPAVLRVQCAGSAQPALEHLEVRSQGPI